MASAMHHLYWTKETSTNNVHPTTTVGIAIFPCLPDPCWRGVSWSSRRRQRL